MSNTKAFIDYAMQDNGSSAREALYSEIHDRVMAHIEAKKIEIAGGILTREEKSCDMDWDDKKKELKKTKKKVKKLKEQVSILEAANCDGSMDDDVDAMKKKLKKSKKKMKKLKEELSLMESGDIDESGEWEGESEEDEESDESSDEE